MDRRKLIIIIVVVVLVVISAIVLTEKYVGKDITITKLASPAVGVHGQNIAVNTTLRNKGIYSTGNFEVHFYLSTTKNTKKRITI